MGLAGRTNDSRLRVDEEQTLLFPAAVDLELRWVIGA